MIQEALARGVVSGSSDQTVAHATSSWPNWTYCANSAQSTPRASILARRDNPSQVDGGGSASSRDRGRGDVEPQDLNHLDDELRAAGFVRALMPFQREELGAGSPSATRSGLLGTRRRQTTSALATSPFCAVAERSTG